MPGQKNKASGNPMRPIQELIRKLNNKRNDKLDDSYDVMSDKFVRQLDRMSRDEVKAVNPKVKKKIDKDSAVKSLIDRVDKAAGNRRKKKKERQAAKFTSRRAEQLKKQYRSK